MITYGQCAEIIANRLTELVQILKDRAKFDARNNQSILNLIRDNYNYMVSLDKKKEADKIISELGEKIKSVITLR